MSAPDSVTRPTPCTRCNHVGGHSEECEAGPPIPKDPKWSDRLIKSATPPAPILPPILPTIAEAFEDTMTRLRAEPMHVATEIEKWALDCEESILAALHAAESSPAMTAREFAAKFGIDAEALIAERKRESDEAKRNAAIAAVVNESAQYFDADKHLAIDVSDASTDDKYVATFDVHATCVAIIAVAEARLKATEAHSDG